MFPRQPSLIFLGTLSLGLSSLFTTLPTQANPTEQTSALNPVIFNQSTAPVGFEHQGRPISRTAGGSRRECTQQLIALLPGEGTPLSGGCNIPSVGFDALTIDERPTLWVYVPGTDRDLEGELVLMDDQQQALTIERVYPSTQDVIIGVRVNYILEVGKTYQWVFTIHEHPDNPAENPAVEGRIQRIATDETLALALEQSTTVHERADVFANAGIWHNALDELAFARMRHPSPPIVESWATLLQSVGLTELTDVSRTLHFDGL